MFGSRGRIARYNEIEPSTVRIRDVSSTSTKPARAMNAGSLVAADRVFVLDDVKLESSGKLSELTDNLDLMLGWMGNVLVNGRQNPAMEAAPGTRERWRFLNAANGRDFDLELPGHTFHVVGWDGGLVDALYETARLLAAPGELVELSGARDETVQLRTLHYDRGHNIPDPGPIDLLAIELAASGPAPAPLPPTFGEVEPIMFDPPLKNNVICSDSCTSTESFGLTIPVRAVPWTSWHHWMFPDPDRSRST